MFIEYGARSFEPTVDLCEHIVPFISTYLLGPDVSDIEEKRKTVMDANLHRFQRVLVLDLKMNTISIISGKGGYSDSYGIGRMGQTWYFGTNRNYGSIMLGTRPFPYAPRSKDDSSSYFVQEAFYLPAGKTMVFDAALFMPAHSLGRHLNRGSARVDHWPEICASVLKAVDPTVATVEQKQEDGKIHTRYFLSRPFVLTSAANVGPSSSFTRLQYWLDFCQTSTGAGGEGHMGVPRVHVADTIGGPQRHWNVDDDYNADAYSAVHGDPLSRSNSSEPKQHPTSCEMERRAPPSASEDPLPTHGRVRRACGALHSSQSPYSAQSPCDVQRVHHLQVGTGAAPGPMSCLEDIISSPHLRPEVGKGPETARAASARGKQVVFASGRGLADVWARDRVFSASGGNERNPFAPVADSLREWKEGRESKDATDKDKEDGEWWSRGRSSQGRSAAGAGEEKDYLDWRVFSEKFNPRPAAAGAGATMNSGVVKKRRLHRAGREEAEDGVRADLLHSSGGMQAHLELDSSDASLVFAGLPTGSLLDGRVEEYKELLRVVHAFGGMHRTYTYTRGATGAAPPQRLVVRPLLAPLMEMRATGGTRERLAPAIEVTPVPGTGTVTTSRPVPAPTNMLPRMCVLTPGLLLTVTNVAELARHHNEASPLNNHTQADALVPTRMLWEAHTESLLLTERRLRTSARPSLVPDPASGGGVGIVEAQGGSVPSQSGIPLSQPPPVCRASFIGRGLMSHYNRLLVLATLRRALLPLFEEHGSFLCDGPAGNHNDGATLYLCRALNIPGDEEYPRRFLAWKLRELVTLLSPAGPLYYALDAWADTDTAAAPLPHHLSSDTTALARKLKQMRGSDPTGRVAAFEAASSSSSLVGGLHAMIDRIEGAKKPKDGPSDKDRDGDKQAGTGGPGAHAEPRLGLNLHLSAGDALVYLFVLPEQFLAAQQLVNRWHKSCEGQNTCFLYVKTHIVVVPAEEEQEQEQQGQRGGGGASLEALDQRHWDAEMSRDAQPSLRLALLQLRESLERGALQQDLVVALVGMPAALSFAAPGTRHNSLVPPVQYGGEGKYNLSAPLLFSSAVPATDTDPRAFAGTGWAVVDMLRELQSSSSSGQGCLHYQHSGNAGVMRAVRCYQRLHPHLVATDPHRVFNKPEGNRRWHWMTDTTHPRGLIEAAKERALYLYAPNTQRANNNIEGVVDVEDFSATEEGPITFNGTYCRIVRAMAIDKKEYLPWFVEGGMNPLAKPTSEAAYGGEIRLGRWLWARRERVKCAQQKMRLLVLLWVGDKVPTHKEPIMDVYEDRTVEEGVHYRQQQPRRDDSHSHEHDTSSGEPPWFQEEQQHGLAYELAQTLSGTNGYPNISHELHGISKELPLAPFGLGVFTINHQAIAPVVKVLKGCLERGMVMGTTSMLMQLHRGFALTLDGSRDTFLQDIVLLKLAELTKFLPHFRQYSPLESYRLALHSLQDHMGGRSFRHLGFNPYSDWDLAAVRSRYGRHQPLREGWVFGDSDSDSDSGEEGAVPPEQQDTSSSPVRPSADPAKATKRMNVAFYDNKRGSYGGNEASVGGEGHWGERGGALATRLLSSLGMVTCVPAGGDWLAGTKSPSSILMQGAGAGLLQTQEGEEVMTLSLGEGRGPDAGPPVEHYLYRDSHQYQGAGSTATYFARAHADRHVNQARDDKDSDEEGAAEVSRLDMPSGYGDARYPHLAAQDAHVGPGGIGREALGNIFASATYSALAGMYSVTGPYHASVSSYAKSIAYADYYTVQARRRRWQLQRQRQLALHQLLRQSQDGPAPEATRARAELGRLAQGPRPTEPFRTHYLAMANKMSDKLHNLLYTAQTSGLTLSVVGLDSDRDSDSGSDSGQAAGERGDEREGKAGRPFDYADKVVAYYAYLSSSLRSGAVKSDDVVVLLDAYDVLLFPDARRIGSHLYEHSPAPIMFCAENGVYPEPASQYMYPHPPHAQAGGGDEAPLGRRYLNSGCVAGRAGQLFRMVQAAYDLRDSFKNDQQFYAKYFLTHPDLVTLDYSSRLFFTSHKSMNCRSRATVTNALSFDYYHADPGPGPGPGTGGKEHRVEGIGVLHANNLASNRVYHVAAQAYKQATDTHLRGPDGPVLLEAIWALADSRDALAARLLSQEAVQTNSSSRGGSNLLADWLLVRHMERLGPQLVRLAAELRLCEYPGVDTGVGGASTGAGLLGLFAPTGSKVSVPPPYRSWYEGAGYAVHTEGAVQCSYVAHLHLRDSLAAVNRARFDAGLSQLPADAKDLVCPMPEDTTTSSSPSPLSSPSCRGLRGYMGGYGPGDAPALDLLQVTLGAQGEEYMWEASGAAFELQQRRLADKLRVNVDKCT